MPVDIVFFGAHPDDVEWGVGGTALLLQGKLSFAIVDLTDGEMTGREAAWRSVEWKPPRPPTFWEPPRVESLHLPDCGLVDSPDNRRRIASVVRRLRPRIVLAPYWEDRHPDHAAAGLIVRNSQLYCTLKKSADPHPPHKPAAFFFYPLHNFQHPSVVIDTSHVFERKLDLIRLHRSQFSKTAEEFGVLAHGVGDYLFGLESRDRYLGSLIGARFGESPDRRPADPPPQSPRRSAEPALLSLFGPLAQILRLLYHCATFSNSNKERIMNARIAGIAALALGMASQVAVSAVDQPSRNIRSITRYTVKSDRAGDLSAAIKEYNVVLKKAGWDQSMSVWRSLTGPSELVSRHLPRQVRRPRLCAFQGPSIQRVLRRHGAHRCPHQQ